MSRGDRARALLLSSEPPRGGSDYSRDISLTLLNSAGEDGTNYNFLDSFLTGYSLPPVDSREDNVEARETVEIVPGYSDNLFD
jgi:hypothetical protein